MWPALRPEPAAFSHPAETAPHTPRNPIQAAIPAV